MHTRQSRWADRTPQFVGISRDIDGDDPIVADVERNGLNDTGGVENEEAR